MAGLQSGENRMMINSVVWAQYINMMHCVKRQNTQTGHTAYMEFQNRDLITTHDSRPRYQAAVFFQPWSGASKSTREKI